MPFSDDEKRKGVSSIMSDFKHAKLYPHPFSPGYWKDAAASLRSLRMLVFAALMIAMTRALSLIPSIPIGHTKFSFGFIARALCATVVGPLAGMLFGFAEDIIGYALQPTGAFFFGYTISTMAGMLVYALCFYRARITILRLLVANTLVNLLVNALMGSLWSAMLAGGGYWALFTVSFVKNLGTIIPKTILMYIPYQALLPILQRMGVMPRQLNDKGLITPW